MSKAEAPRLFLVIKDFYHILSVPRNAPDAEIRRAYRELMKKFHPDVNHSVYASERAIQINEAYHTLSDPTAKSLYDMDLREFESKSRRPSQPGPARQQARPQAPPASHSRESFRPPQPEPQPETGFSPSSDLRCEKCGAWDSSLRIAVTWRVCSWIKWARKIPSSGLLCNRCLVKQSLRDSLISLILGWWSIYGFFWTLSALLKNALGGDQPAEQNASLLRALSYQLYSKGRHAAAYRALVRANGFQHHSASDNLLRSMSGQVAKIRDRSFWTRCRALDLPPIFYHANAGLGLVLLFFLLSHLTWGTGASEHFRSFRYPPYVVAPSPSVTESDPDLAPSHPAIQISPVDSEAEVQLPELGPLFLGDLVNNPASPDVAKLEIHTRPGDGHYVVKVEDWDTREFVAEYFIPSGSTLSTMLPLGSYRLKLASGRKWFGSEKLFGRRTAYSIVSENFTFSRSGNTTYGYNINLVPSVGGSLHQEKLPPQAW